LYQDVFDQEGGRLQLVTPIQATLDQAKATINRKRKCKKKRACKQTGFKVYNPKVNKRKYKAKRWRKLKN
jgi:hypothetical protein